MNHYRVFIFLLVAVAVGLSSCATNIWQVSQTALVSTKDGQISAQFPIGWVVARPSPGFFLITKEGPSLQSISVWHDDFKTAFKSVEREIDVSILPTELAELYSARLRKEFLNASLERISLEPAIITGQDGFKIRHQLTNNKGLRIALLSYGWTDQTGVFFMRYQAPLLHYYHRDLKVFEQAVASVQIP